MLFLLNDTSLISPKFNDLANRSTRSAAQSVNGVCLLGVRLLDSIATFVFRTDLAIRPMATSFGYLLFPFSFVLVSRNIVKTLLAI